MSCEEPVVQNANLDGKIDSNMFSINSKVSSVLKANPKGGREEI